MTFGMKDKKEFIRTSIIFYVVNIFISGSTFFIMYFTGIDNTKISFIIACAYFSCELLKYIYSELKTTSYIDNIKKEINISLFDKNLNCNALVDSGNLLKDPLGQNDVVIIKPSLLKGIIPDFILYSKNVYDVLDLVDKEISSKIKLIPYKDISNTNNNLILGFKANYIEIDNKKIGNIVLGISDFDEEEYDAILNPNILN